MIPPSHRFTNAASTVRGVLGGAVLILVLAACGVGAAPSGVASLESPGADGAASAAPSASLDPEAAQLAFARCMREHGIEMPDPQTAPGGGTVVQIGGDGVDPAKLQEASQACDHFLKDAFGGRQEPDPAMLDKMVKFAGCMREHGIDFPDPGADGNQVFTFGGGDGPDPNSSEFQTAQKACQSILGTDGPVFGGSGPDGASGPGGDTSGGTITTPESSQ